MDFAYHIQRGTIKRPLTRDTRFSEAVDLDYMGSAEFEWGALPKSLRELQANVDNIKLTVEPRIQDEEGRSLRVLHTFDTDAYEAYVSLLVDLREGTRRTKESTYFDKDHKKRFKTLECDLWWDIDAHAMWSFDKQFMNRLGEHLVASWKYMDEQKAKR